MLSISGALQTGANRCTLGDRSPIRRHHNGWTVVVVREYHVLFAMGVRMDRGPERNGQGGAVAIEMRLALDFSVDVQAQHCCHQSLRYPPSGAVRRAIDSAGSSSAGGKFTEDPQRLQR